VRSPLAVVQGAGEHHLAHFPHGSGWNGVGPQRAPRRAVRPLFTMDKGLAPNPLREAPRRLGRPCNGCRPLETGLARRVAWGQFGTAE